MHSSINSQIHSASSLSFSSSEPGSGSDIAAASFTDMPGPQSAAQIPTSARTATTRRMRLIYFAPIGSCMLRNSWTAHHPKAGANRRIRRLYPICELSANRRGQRIQTGRRESNRLHSLLILATELDSCIRSKRPGYGTPLEKCQGRSHPDGLGIGGSRSRRPLRVGLVQSPCRAGRSPLRRVAGEAFIRGPASGWGQQRIEVPRR